MSFKPRVIELPLFPDPSRIIDIVGSHESSFFLDSSDPNHSASRFSYAGINPRAILSGDHSPWSNLAEASRELAGNPEETPFLLGGLVGYLSYEAYQFIEPFGVPSHGNGPIPGHWFGLYDSVLILDHHKRKAFVGAYRYNDRLIQDEVDRWMDLLSKSSLNVDEPQLGGNTSRKDLPYDSYAGKISRIKGYLEAGDVYQINLTQRFETESSLLASSLYKRLRQISPVPFGAFIHAGPFQVLSASPELFLQIRGNRIQTWPIKGTRRRYPSLKQDLLSREELTLSPKDRAELLMIVDLERNDLGRICEYGSVHVDSVFNVESFAEVHHLTASVSGVLKKGTDPVLALKGLFPGGSVTGAPKRRAIEIIDELEETPRSVYTGALGYIGAGGVASMNMPIRTLTKVGSKVYYHAGGGIVIDSDAKSEYEEMMVKASGMIRALGHEDNNIVKVDSRKSKVEIQPNHAYRVVAKI